MRPHLDLNHKASPYSTTAAFILFLCLPASVEPIDPNYAQRAQVKLAQTSSYRFELSVQTVIDGQDKKVALLAASSYSQTPS